ncbi:MAG: response regulator [Candidatus Dormibacteraceae bacterium]
MIRVLVADDQSVVREGLVLMLTHMDGIEVVGAAKDGDEAVRLVAELEPDIALLDLRMPRQDGVEATRAIVSGKSKTRVIVLTTYADDQSILAALQAGAQGYLTKHTPASEIQRAIELVHRGQVQLDPVVQQRLVARVSSRGQVRESPAGLTGKELEVLRLMAQGLGNAEIAQRLFVSGATVKTHVNNIFSKLEVRDRAAAVSRAFRMGLVNDDESS